MAFTPITSDQSLSYVRYNTYYRNANRESNWGEPVYFTPYDRGFDLNGFGGPHYEYGYNYSNSPETAKGNCTWWCAGRLQETMGKNIMALMNWASPSADGWYDAFTGTRHTNASNAHAGDIICFSGGEDGHVMFIEKIENGVVYISHSAWSTRSYWDDMACRVNEYNVSDIYAGASINMYKGTGSSYYVTVQGIIHTGEDSPTPPEPSETPNVTVYPSSVDAIMTATEDYLDFDFTVVVSGILSTEDASNGFSFSSNCYRYAYLTGWSYTEYVVDGVTYRTGTRRLTVRYDRLHDYAYTDTAYMYYQKTFTHGSVNSSTPMRITIREKEQDDSIIAILMAHCRNRKRARIKIK